MKKIQQKTQKQIHYMFYVSSSYLLVFGDDGLLD